MSVENEQLLLNEDVYIEDTMRHRYLTFELDSEEYAVEIAYVREIVNMKPITRIPDTPDYVEGIINVRGDIAPVIDIRKRFLKPSRPADESASIIIFVEYKDYYLGLVADAVIEVLTIESEFIVPPPSAKLNYHNQFVKSIGKVGTKVKQILDLDRLLAQE